MTITPVTPNDLVSKVEVVETKVDSTSISGSGAPTTSTAGTVGLLYQDTTNGDIYICKVADTSTPSYTWEKVSGALLNTATGTNSLTIAGNSTNQENSTNIGVNSSATGVNATAIGQGASATGRAVAIGDGTSASGIGSTAIGRGSKSTAKGAIAIGCAPVNSESNTFKVSLNGDATISNPAVDEDSKLYTLLKSDGKIPFARVTDVDQLHDHFAFKRNSMSVYSQSYTTDGTNWVEDTKNLNKLWISKDRDTDTTVLNANEIGYTFTLTSTQFRYSEIECFEISTAWVNPASTFDLKIEKSVDAETWDTIVNKTGMINQKMYYLPTSSKVSGETAYIRFTFTKTSNLDTGTVKLLTIRALTNRIGGQGMAREYAYPFSWDVNNTLLPLSGGSLGTSSSKWTNLYVKNLYPDSFSPSSIKVNNRPATGLYYYNFQVSNMNNYPYHRIAKVLEVDATKQWLDACAFVDIYGNYNGGWFGRIKLSFRTDTKTTSPFGKVEAKWIERYGFAEDSVKIGLYTITDGDNSKAYADIFLKANSTYQCFQLKVVKGSRSALTDDRSEGTVIIFNDTTESNNDTTITECYSDIQGTTAGTAAHDLHNDVQYTSITSSIDSAVVKEAKQIYQIDLTNVTADMNTLFSKTVGDILCYKETSSPNSVNITNKPYNTDMFYLESHTMRYIDSVRCILQKYISGTYKKILTRWGTGDSSTAPDGITWSEWQEEATIVQSPNKEGIYESAISIDEGVPTNFWKKDLFENTIYRLTETEKEKLLETGLFNDNKVKTGQLFETEDGDIVKFKDQINPTGFNVTYTSLGLRQWWKDMAYGDGVFVAVSQGNADSDPTNIVIYSYDGINWKQTTIPFVNKLDNVTYCKDRFICVSRERDYTYPTTDNRGIYSYDGITWQTFNLPTDSAWYDSAYGNGVFVAVGYNCGATSTDGINWTSIPSANIPTEGWNYINFIDGKFIASGYHNFSISTDGINWTNYSDSNVYFKDCVYAFGKYYSLSSGYLYSSPTGETWTQVSGFPNKSWQVLNFADGVLSAICWDHIYYTTDGTTWGDQLVDYFRWYDLIPVNGRYYSAIGDVTKGAVIDYIGTHTYSLENYNIVRNTATGTDSISLFGKSTSSNNAVNVGFNSESIGSGSLALGNSAKATSNYSIGLNGFSTASGAIVLGNGKNTEPDTFKVALQHTSTRATDEASGLYTLLNSSGNIPLGRLPLNTYIKEGANITFEKPFINVERYGKDLVINNGVISNFTTSSYVSTINAIDLQRNFEFYIKVNSGTFTSCSTNSYFIGSETNWTRNIILGFNKTSKKLALYLSSDGKNSDICSSKNGTYVFSENTDYKFKLTFDGSYYKVYYSLDDGETWIEDISVTSNTYIATNRIDFYIHESRTNTSPSDASIDFSQTFITSNGSIIWQGLYPDAYGISSSLPRRVLDNIALGQNSLSIGGSAATNQTATNVGISSSTGNSGTVAIGYNARATGQNSTAVGCGSEITAPSSIAIGQNAKSTATQAFEIGPGTNSDHHTLKIGFFLNNNFIGYTLLDGNTGKIPGDRMSLQDASAPTTSTVGSVGQFYVDTSNQDAYICVKADTITPEYIWKKITV